MNHLLPIGLYQKLRRIDRIVRIGLNQILPRNLTIRYIAALIAVALLAVSGQLIIQASLARQGEDQRKLRALEGQIRDSENLRKTILSLKLDSKTQETRSKIEIIESLALQFQKNDQTLKMSDSGSTIHFQPSAELTTVLEKIESNLKMIIENCHILKTTVGFPADIRSEAIIVSTLNQEFEYRSALKEMSKYFNHRLEQKILEAKRIEIFLLLITLAVLVIEALYVFRPGVESLYDALRVRSEFLGRMGHEMRNPMNSIMGMTNLLIETPLTDQQKKYLSILQKSSHGLLEVLNNLLDFSNIEAGTLKMESISFDFYKLLERSIDLAVYGAHSNGIELVLDLKTNVPLKIIGDPGRLQQILVNLLGNAVKFTKKGEVVLRVQLQKRIEEIWIEFSVIDTGMGIDKKKIDRIFDAFVQEDSTVRRRFGGTGLGLSISKDLVVLLGGSLSVESQKNIGSRFFFTLPFELSETTTIEDNIRQFNLGTYDAFILEPNESIFKTLSSLILESGGQTTRIEPVEKLDTTFLKLTQSIHRREVIIIDYEFSKDSLPILLSRIRRGVLKPNSFVFLIKTTASSTDIEKLAEYGLRNFLFKPVRPLQLIEAIAQGLSHEIAARPVASLEMNKEIEPEKIDLIHDNRILRVLAVDDSKDNQFLVKAYLESLPYRIVFADHGRIAVERFKTARFDIVLMDLQMPEMDGYTATQCIRDWEQLEGLTPTPIIAVSAHDNESGSDRFQKAQFSAYLLKPISPNQLRRAIHNFTRHIPLTNLVTNSTSQPSSSTAIEDLEKQLADLAPQYLKSRTQELQTLRSLLKEFNFETIQTLGHRLKGNAKSYGFEELGLIGNKLEEAARERSAEKIEHLILESETYIHQAHLNL